MQNAYVVNDLHAAIRDWAALGLGPFYVVENAQMPCTYRSQPSVLNISVAQVQAGAINIELIQQHDAEPSVYRDVYAPGEEGFHHVCMVVDDLAKERRRYQDLGCDAAMEGELGSLRFSYMDARRLTGGMIELVEDGAAIREINDRIRLGAETWDGSDLIRPTHPES